MAGAHWSVTLTVFVFQKDHLQNEVGRGEVKLKYYFKRAPCSLGVAMLWSNDVVVFVRDA